MTFNDKLDLFLKERHYKNLKQLAADCDIPYTTLRDFYEKKSANNSRLSTIRKLSTFMGCTMDYLAYDEVTDPSHVKVPNQSEPLSDPFHDDFISQYRSLFEMDDRLSDEQKKFFLDFLEERHKEIDKKIK